MIVSGKLEITNFIIQSPLCLQKINSKYLNQLKKSVRIKSSSNTRFGFTLRSGGRIEEVQNDSVADEVGFEKGDKIVKGQASKILKCKNSLGVITTL